MLRPETITPAAHYEHHEMDPRGVLSIPLDAPALPPGPGLGVQDEEVLARLRTMQGGAGGSYLNQAEAATLLVVRNEDGISFRAVGPYGNTLENQTVRPERRIDPRQVTTRTGAPDVRYAFTAGAGKKDAAVLHIAPAHSNAHVRATTAAGAASESEPGTTIETVADTNFRHRAAKWTRKLATVALLGLVVAGGDKSARALDAGMDSVTDAGAVVELTLGADPAEQQAIQRVSAAMDALDRHDDTAIEAGADRFLQERMEAGDIMPPETVPFYLARVERASTHQEIISTLDGFMRFYGKSAIRQGDSMPEIGAYDEGAVKLETLRDTALGIIDGVSIMPRSHIAAGRYPALAIGTPIVKPDGTAWTGGYVSWTDGRTELIMAAADYGASTRSKAAWRMIHEHDHSLKTLNGDAQVTAQQPGPVRSKILDAASRMGMPLAVSGYAAANDVHERQAESRAALLGDESTPHRIAHPDEHRLYISPANRDMLAELIKLEKSYESITYWLLKQAGTSRHKR